MFVLRDCSTSKYNTLSAVDRVCPKQQKYKEEPLPF